ncbi:DUF1318 domain-containing protein [Candidatus Omnitrophota bacterium]
MYRVYVAVVLCVIVSLGCARVSVEAPKEAIKLDISMRIDVYQHIQNDIDAIEDIVSGSGGDVSSTDQQSMLNFFLGTAYAQDELDATIKDAALRRKEKLPELQSLMSVGVIGENSFGLLEIVDTGAASSATEKLVEEENADRMIIYKELARKNNTPLKEIQGIYSLRLQEGVPSGAPIEVLNKTTGALEWKNK